jgi:rubrerythrin
MKADFVSPLQPTSEVLEAIETAVRIEEEGLLFYTEAAKQVDDPKGKQMFQTLAKDEQAHLELFKSAREALFTRGAWLSPEEVAEISPDKPAHPAIFPPVGHIETGEVKVPEHHLAVLRRGIEAENASITFYSQQMARADDPDGKAMYAYLVSQEEAHRKILKGEYDYLTGTGFWFDTQEFNLEGAG